MPGDRGASPPRRFLSALLLLLLAPACLRQADPAEIRAAVERYNGMLRRAYLEANPELLDAVATARHRAAVLPVIQALRAKNSSMIAEQQEFRVLGIETAADTARLRAEEKWRYWWQDVRTGRITRPLQEIRYRLVYHLVRSGGGTWKVDRTENMDGGIPSTKRDG